MSDSRSRSVTDGNSAASPSPRDSTPRSPASPRKQQNGDDAPLTKHSPRSRSSRHHEDPVTPRPATLEDLTHEELVCEVTHLKEEIELMKGALRRSSNGASTILQLHQYHRLQASFDKKAAEYKAESIKARAMESALAEVRNQTKIQLNQKEAESKRALDMLASVRAEAGALKEKAKEDASLITILSKENHRLLALCHLNHINTKDAPPDYVNSIAAINGARPEKANSKIPSAKSVLHMSPTNFRKEFLQTSKSKSAHRESLSISRGVSPNERRRSQSRDRSHSPHAGINGRTDHSGVTAGSVVQWKGMRGTIRFIGPVVPLGTGNWAGVELAEGRGEHSGAAFGQRYFNAPPRSSVFCRISELVTIKESNPGTPMPETPPRNRFIGNLPTTKAERRQFLAFAQEGSPPKSPTKQQSSPRSAFAEEGASPDVAPVPTTQDTTAANDEGEPIAQLPPPVVVQQDATIDESDATRDVLENTLEKAPVMNESLGESPAAPAAVVEEEEKVTPAAAIGEEAPPAVASPVQAAPSYLEEEY